MGEGGRDFPPLDVVSPCAGVLVHNLQQSPRYALDGREGRSAGGTVWREIMSSLLNMAVSMLVPANLQINILR